MDGNRRWAKARNLYTKEGHKEGVEALERVVKASIAENIEQLTVYALSTENIKERTNTEIKDLFDLIKVGFVNKLPILKKEGVSVCFIGNIGKLPFAIRKALSVTEKELSKNRKLRLVVALNYGSRQEILEAATKLKQEDITESVFSQNLYTKNFPDPDLLIRTGGQKRLSNFLLWQAAYSELYFTDVLWPDFNEREFKKAVEDFYQRQRNFGA
jgi:undecaprenyl diphosphate synthase